MRIGKVIISGLAVSTGLMYGQTLSRKAILVGRGNPGGGKCTLEVQVDGTARIEVRGDSALLRNTGGQAPQWRRFECTGALPSNPSDFRFAGVDGRGRQSLITDPRNNGGAAVIDIEDRDGGAESYTFDLFWGNGPAVSGGGIGDNRSDGRPDDRPMDRGSRQERGFDSGDRFDGRDRRTTNDEAVQVCRRSIRDQAVDRFATPNIDIRNISIDDNPGRCDWVLGDLAVRRRFGRVEVYRFSCAVNFNTGAIRSIHIDQFVRDAYQDRK